MTILLLFMALALCFVSLLMFRIAHGNDLRTQGQRAADAAALGAAAEIRDRAAQQIVDGALPYGIIYQNGSEQAAREYADKNGAKVEGVHASGLFGYTVKVDIKTKECQTKLREDTTNRIACETPQDRSEGNYQTAEAVAEVEFPLTCRVRPRGSASPTGGPDSQPVFAMEVVCGADTITDLADARKLFRIKLVDEEDDEPFNPNVFNPAPGGPIPPGGVQNEANRQLGKQLAAQRGWTGQEWECLDQLWQHESGWNHVAENPSSGAYGIPQSLPPEKMGTHGPDYRSNPSTQIRWGMDYIAARPDYGTPCRAWALWQSRSPHWY